MTFQLGQVSPRVWSILEEATRGSCPLSYLVVGDEKVLMIDTGGGRGDIHAFVKAQSITNGKKIIVVNTHNHPEQTGGNFLFSTTGRHGISHMVEDLCASGRDPYYTQLLNSSYQWDTNTYKITKWLADGATIMLGNPAEAHNVVEVMWTPGHTPDSLVLWYASDMRLFTGDLFYRFDDILMAYEFSDIKQYEASLRKVLNFVSRQPHPKQVRYSASKNDIDFECLPTFKHFHRFLLGVLAGTHIGSPLRIDVAEGWRFETRDKAMRIVLGRDIVQKLNQAREKVPHY